MQTAASCLREIESPVEPLCTELRLRVLSLHLQAAPARTHRNHRCAFPHCGRSRVLSACWYGIVQLHECTCGSMIRTEPFDARKSRIVKEKAIYLTILNSVFPSLVLFGSRRLGPPAFAAGCGIIGGASLTGELLFGSGNSVRGPGPDASKAPRNRLQGVHFPWLMEDRK